MPLIGRLSGVISVSCPIFPSSVGLIVPQGARMYIGIGVAVPATSLCIARRLYKIAAVRNVVTSKAEVCLTDPSYVWCLT